MANEDGWRSDACPRRRPSPFGFISGALGGPCTSIGAGGGVAHNSALAYTFLIMLAPVTIGGAILLLARRTYPRDVATASASIVATSGIRGDRRGHQTAASRRRARRNRSHA